MQMKWCVQSEKKNRCGVAAAGRHVVVNKKSTSILDRLFFWLFFYIFFPLFALFFVGSFFVVFFLLSTPSPPPLLFFSFFIGSDVAMEKDMKKGEGGGE